MKKHRGFTLAELILCIGIIGVVSAMGMTIAKINTDRAYNMYYYTGYINLYNAIADAKASGIEDNQTIMQHVYKLLSKDANVASVPNIPNNNNGVGWVEPNEANANVINGRNGIRYYYANSLNNGMNGIGTLQIASLPQGLEIPFMTYKAIGIENIGTAGTGSNKLPNQIVPEKYKNYNSNEGEEISDPINGSSTSTGTTGSSKPEPDSQPSTGTTGGSEPGSGSNPSTGDDPDNPDSNAVPSGTITKAIPITMTVPQRKNSNNPDGFATVRLLYVNLNGGYLIPITAGSSVDLQNRRDLLSAFVDNGKVGRNNAIDRTNFSFTRPAYGSYRESFCSISGLGSIDGVINCGGITANKIGVLKITDPRKAR